MVRYCAILLLLSFFATSFCAQTIVDLVRAVGSLPVCTVSLRSMNPSVFKSRNFLAQLDVATSLLKEFFRPSIESLPL